MMVTHILNRVARDGVIIGAAFIGASTGVLAGIVFTRRFITPNIKKGYTK